MSVFEPGQAYVWGDASGVLDRLCGVWRLDRRIEGLATLIGVARFDRAADDAMVYHEEGRLKLDAGPTLDAERRYLFRRTLVGFDVHFAEPPNALFHRIALAVANGALEGRSDHLCKDDLYESLYRFTPDGAIFIRHVVNGPRKAYVSTSTLSPLS